MTIRFSTWPRGYLNNELLYRIDRGSNYRFQYCHGYGAAWPLRPRLLYRDALLALMCFMCQPECVTCWYISQGDIGTPLKQVLRMICMECIDIYEMPIKDFKHWLTHSDGTKIGGITDVDTWRN